MTNMTPRLWILTLVPPATWAAHLYVAYSLHAAACESQTRLPLLLTSLVCLAIVTTSAFFSWTTTRALQTAMPDGGAGMNDDQEPRQRGRARFLATAAFAASVFFGLVILGQTVPMIVLRACD